MLRRAGAIVLVVLTVLPFTAPFPTCDMSSLFGRPLSAFLHQTTVTSSVEDGSQVVPLVTASNTIRLRLRHIAETRGDAAARIVRVATPTVCRSGFDARGLTTPESPGPLRI